MIWLCLLLRGVQEQGSRVVPNLVRQNCSVFQIRTSWFTGIAYPAHSLSQICDEKLAPSDRQPIIKYRERVLWEESG